MQDIDRERCREFLNLERERFQLRNPKSRALFTTASSSFLNGVPMNWMTKWASPFPLFARSASGAWLIDVDGHRYLDLCLGDTAAFFGHAPSNLAQAISQQAQSGLALMMPTEDIVAVGAALKRQFGLPYWQVALSATDANRFAIRLARAITGRQKILVFNGCYHGSLVETLVELDGDRIVPNADILGAECDPVSTTRVVEFNDLAALDEALSFGDVACVLAEPVLTNCGVVLPEDGFHEGLRACTRKHGALLLIDETHSICAAPGGYSRAHELKPDILTLGKSAGGGVATAVFGFSQQTKEKIDGILDTSGPGIYAVGGTLAGNALSMTALKVCLDELMTDAAYAVMSERAEAIERGITDCIRANGLSWYTVRLGACVGYGFHPCPPRNGGEALREADSELDTLLHLFLINRGILITPFQNQLLVSPQVRPEDGEHHTRVFNEFVEMITAR